VRSSDGAATEPEGQPRQRRVPRHIAIIMDGNGRWAQARGLRRIEGHREGVKRVHEIVEVCGQLGVEVLTLYTFSRENWRRPRSEISALMELLVSTTAREIDSLMRNKVQLRIIGRLRDLPLPARQALSGAVRHTSRNSGLILNLALSYGGRQEIVDAARALFREGSKTVTEESFAAHLYTAGLPDPDLLIRTSGEMRLSNFLLWQLAYAEIVVTDVLWPDFGKVQLLTALEEYGRRSRRFGGIEESP
jgi:undecaprenyl diphosphate synthase